jgi:DNA-binding CsgD family transcriptional regulator
LSLHGGSEYGIAAIQFKMISPMQVRQRLRINRLTPPGGRENLDRNPSAMYKPTGCDEVCSGAPECLFVRICRLRARIGGHSVAWGTAVQSKGKGISKPGAGSIASHVSDHASDTDDWHAFQSGIDWECVRRELGLSSRELQVTQRIFEGKKLMAIAQDLQLGLGTVKTYCQRIHNKLDVTDQRGLLLAVLDAHLDILRRSQ